MKSFVASLLWVVTAAAPATESLEQRYAALGRLIVTQFVSAPFPHPARAEGHKYQDRIYPAKEHYADSTVAIFIPKGFRESANVDFVIHFHGWNNTVAGTLGGYKLIEQFVAGDRNACSLFPKVRITHPIPSAENWKIPAASRSS